MRKSYRSIFTGCFVLLLLGSCSKYSKVQPIGGDTYLRIFNTITNYDPRQLNGSTQQNFLTFRTLCILIDPTQDGSGRFDGAAMIGDYLGIRPSYSGPYEIHPNNEISNYENTEWPGAYRVQTGGVINGLDLSRWARVPSGKHRLVALRRGGTGVRGSGIYFTQYTPAGRDTAFQTAIDTTLELEQQSIYTMEVVSRSTTDASPLKLLLRKETLAKENFSDSSAMYVNFYNYLETSASPAALDVYYQTEYVVNTFLLLQGTVALANSSPPSWAQGSSSPYDKVVSPERMLTKITEKFATAAPYVKIPMPPVDSFYYTQGVPLGQYRLAFDRPHTLLKFYLPGQSAATGATPLTQVSCDEYNGQLVMDAFPQYPPLGYLGSLYQTVTSPRGASRSIPLVSTLTLTTIYTQLNKASNGVQIYQSSLQRPAPADLLQ